MLPASNRIKVAAITSGTHQQQTASNRLCRHFEQPLSSLLPRQHDGTHSHVTGFVICSVYTQQYRTLPSSLTRLSRSRSGKLSGFGSHFLEHESAVQFAGFGEAAVTARREPWPEVPEQWSCILHTVACCKLALCLELIHCSMHVQRGLSGILTDLEASQRDSVWLCKDCTSMIFMQACVLKHICMMVQLCIWVVLTKTALALFLQVDKNLHA